MEAWCTADKQKRSYCSCLILAKGGPVPDVPPGTVVNPPLDAAVIRLKTVAVYAVHS